MIRPETMSATEDRSRQSTGQREVTLRFLAQPADINFGGKVHGGAVMKWIDQAAYACAVGWSRQYCVTVYVGGIRFYKPIVIGHLVEVEAKIIYTGRTSMHVAVDVSSGDPKEAEFAHSTQCIVIFVAVDGDGNLLEVRPWIPLTNEDKSLEQYAIKLMALRREIEQQLKADRVGAG